VPVGLYAAEVPMSSQWDSAGYYYPTQIAQYGLSHYSKHVVDRRRLKTGPGPPPGSKPSTRASAAAGDQDARSTPIAGAAVWRQLGTNGFLRRIYDDAVQRSVYQFQTPGRWRHGSLLIQGSMVGRSFLAHPRFRITTARRCRSCKGQIPLRYPGR